jgi:hypothetical protein
MTGEETEGAGPRHGEAERRPKTIGASTISIGNPMSLIHGPFRHVPDRSSATPRGFERLCTRTQSVPARSASLCLIFHPTSIRARPD